MRLYYLTSVAWAKVILNEQRLKLSEIEKLNDPFELLGVSIGDQPARKVVRYVRRRLRNTFGLICMSETWQNPVMWAHYGDKHQGVCFGFDVVDGAAKPVHYEPKRLEQLLGVTPRLTDVTQAMLETLMTTKYKDWAYEQEWRLIVGFRHAIKDKDGKHFLPFDNQFFVLKEVILGYNCPWQMHEAATAVGNVAQEVLLKRVRPSFQKFEMVRQQRVDTISVVPKDFA